MHRSGFDQGDSKARSGRAPAPGVQGTGALDWRTVDRALLGIQRSRCALDADEARWLREAERVRIWSPLGMVSMLDYLERRLAYSPRTAQERMRVARALGALPELTAALADGTFAYSAVRELSRVATPATEAVWIAAATGKSLRQIEDLVADHRPGDNPDDPPDPRARTHENEEYATARVAIERVACEPSAITCLAPENDEQGPTTVAENERVAREPRTASAAAPRCRARGSTGAPSVIDQHGALRVRDDRCATAAAAPGPAGARGAHVDAGDKLAVATLRARAQDALVGLGWKRAVAHLAVAEALAAAGHQITLEPLIFEALRRCPVPKA
ncbi:MAG TPA: hypothetical protein VFT22_32170 [Kofleriaceae bacterium]|nr:hypothetical protein [Kofleriaceae bacterium]